MSKPLKIRLKEKMDARKVKIPALSVQTGIPKDRIYAWYRDNSSPKADDQEKLEKWINGEISIIEPVENANRGTFVGPSEQAIVDIASSNKTLAEANKTLADAHKIIARNNEDLIKMVKPKTEPEEGIQLSEPAILKGLLVALAEIGSGKKWSSKKEALQELGRIVNLPDSEKSKSEGIHADEDTNSTV